ncbi:MAG: hypothetical protein R6U37_03270 [Dehalococcoidia bacterium]
MAVFSWIGDILFGPRILASVRDVEWHGRVWGEMTVSRGEVCIFEKRTVFLFREDTEMGLQIPMVLIASDEIDAEKRMIINWIDKDDNPFEEVINFKNQGDAGVIAAAIGKALKELGEESKRAQLERAERMQRQKEERERQKESQRVQEERELVWKTVGHIWGAVLELNRLMLALPGEDWKTIESSWKKMQNIADKTVLDLSLGINSFMPALESRSADEMYKDTLSFIELLGDSIKAIQIARVEEEDLARKYESFPQWRHVPYFLIFALVYAETILSYKASDNDTVVGNIALLRRLAPVMQEEFGMKLEESINLFAAGLETGDSSQVKATGEVLENYITEAVEGKETPHDE